METSALILTLIHPTSGKMNSPKLDFRFTAFSEIVASVSQLCYLVCNRSGGEREEGGEEKTCDWWRLCLQLWL
jgi:hypothetical protein